MKHIVTYSNNNVVLHKYRSKFSLLFPSLSRLFLPYFLFSLLTEAVVVIEYEKQHYGELTLNVGDVITNVKPVC